MKKSDPLQKYLEKSSSSINNKKKVKFSPEI